MLKDKNMICDYEINFYDIDGNETYCWNDDIEYITDRIYEHFRGVFEDIEFWVKKHRRTDTLNISIKGYKKTWHFSFEIDKEIKSLASEINNIARYISKNTK